MNDRRARFLFNCQLDMRALDFPAASPFSGVRHLNTKKAHFSQLLNAIETKLALTQVTIAAVRRSLALQNLDYVHNRTTTSHIMLVELEKREANEKARMQRNFSQN